MNEENKIPLPGAMDPQPQAPDFLQGDEWFDTQVDGDFLDFDEPYRPPRYTMERDGVPFADVGELHIISGKPGNGKTGLMSQLEAATLGRQFGNTLARDVGHIVRDEQGNIVNGEDRRPVFQQRPTRILHIDTEQGKDDTIAFKNRVISMSGISKDEAKEHFFILRLRDTELASDRWKKILKAIYVVQPTDIFLDGMLDIVEDYNDQKECQPIIRKCMMLATYYDTSVIKVKQADLKPNEQRPDLPDIYFRVKQNKARGRDVADWLFQYVTNAGGWGQPVEIEDNGVKVINSKEIQLMKECDERFKSFNWTSSGASYSDLDKHLAGQGITSNRKKDNLINAAKEFGILTTTGTKGHFKYHYNGLKAPQADEPNELPFDKNEGNGDAPF